jgi:hypothetical protein
MNWNLPKTVLLKYFFLVFISTSMSGCGKSEKGDASMLNMNIPAEYFINSPKPSDDYFIIAVDYPTMKPYGSQVGIATSGSIRIEVSSIRRTTRVEGFLEDYERLKNKNVLTRPIYLGVKDEFDTYENLTSETSKNREIWKIRRLADGNHLGFNDPGSFSSKITGNRRAPVGNMEISYQFSKSLESESMKIDAAVVELIADFSNRTKGEK